MANLIALEINEEDILVAAARSSGKRVQFTKILEVPLPDDATESVMADLLKKALANEGVPRGDALVVLGRQQIEMREISVPPAPESELPDMVRFQARSDFSAFNEGWSLDYVPFKCQNDQPQRVLAGAVSPQLMERSKGLVEEAGLKLSKMVLRPYSTIELVRSSLADDRARMIIDPNEEQIDLTLVIGSELMATRTVRTSKDYESAEVAQNLAGQIRRTLASTANLLEGQPVVEFLVIGAEDRLSHMQKMLAENFEQGVSFTDPYQSIPGISAVTQDLPPHPERFAALLGALLREASGQDHTIDFIHPRQPVINHDNRSRIYLFGGLAAAMLICMVVVGWWLLSSQDARIAELNNALRDIKKTNEGDRNQPGVEQITGEVNLIDEWQTKNINWLDELYEFSQRFETPDDAIVDSMTLSANEKNVGLSLKGRVGSIGVGSVLKTNLTARPYVVRAGRTVEEPDDKDYPIKFESMFVELATDIDATIEKINQAARDKMEDPADQPLDADAPNEEAETNAPPETK
ncbi:MAG: hypothetical protein VYE64_10130 [Planctomycetota bacterium]|nr:hypothetical protein [Planctomycetota bacterium]